jgi:hypothetical protein
MFWLGLVLASRARFDEVDRRGKNASALSVHIARSAR